MGSSASHQTVSATHLLMGCPPPAAAPHSSWSAQSSLESACLSSNNGCPGSEDRDLPLNLLVITLEVPSSRNWPSDSGQALPTFSLTVTLLCVPCTAPRSAGLAHLILSLSLKEGVTKPTYK